MKTPLLSVCLLTYNHAAYVREAIDSILVQQTTFDWQLIVADDCSTDGTKDILLEYQKEYPDRIKLIIQKSNVGPEKNWLDLIDYPKSKYLLYAEGDDYFTDPTKLQRQVDFLEAHDDFALCFHPVKVVYQDGSKPDEVFPSPEQRSNKTVLGLDDLLMSNFIQTNSAMYRWQFNKTSIKDVFPRGISPGDWFLHLLHAQAGKLGFIDRVMAAYRRHPGGIWWESDRNLDNIWRKYGVAHIKLYTEMSKIKTSHKAVHDSIIQKIQKLFYDLGAIDGRKNEGLVRAAIEQVPAATELFIKAQSKDLLQAAENAKKLEDKLYQLQQELADREKQLWHREEQLQQIKASRIWKLRNKLAVLRGKKQL